MNFDDILKRLESDSKILDFRFAKSQIPMYLVVRFMLLQSLINKEFNLSNPHVKTDKKSIKEILKYIYHTLKSNIFFAPKKDIYIFSSDILNVLDGVKYKNRLHYGLCQIYDNQTELFETSHNTKYKEPKYKKTYFIDLILILRNFFSFFTKNDNIDLLNIELLVEYINIKIKLDATQTELLMVILKKYSKMINIEYYLYDLFIKIKKPKLLILDCAYYGVHIPLILVAKKHEVKIAEYQHGYVGFAHPAYNYSNIILDKIKKYFPEYFLTHGKYWSDRVRVPSKKIEIGLSELESKLELSKIKEKEKSILFVSGGTVYKELNFLIDSVIKYFQGLGYKVILRTHPSENIELNKRYANLFKKGLIIDSLLLYERLEKTEIVISMEVSTVLFEAVCFTNKIYMMNTNYTRYYEQENPFISFDNSDDLILNISKDITMQQEMNYFWKTNCKENYKKFIKNNLWLKN